MNRAAAVGRSLAALAALAALVVGVPAALWRFVGWPLPHAVPGPDEFAQALSQRYLPDEALINALAIVCWIAWAPLAASVAVEAFATARGRIAVRVPGAGPLQTLAARLVAAALAAALTTPRPPAAAPPQPPTAELVVEDEITLAVATAPVADEPETAAPLPVHTVARYDDLWSIAERRLGDPYRWRQIWDLNRGRQFPDGRSFADPDLIHPGWVLRLPADAAPVEEWCATPPAATSAASPPIGVEDPQPADAAETRPVAPSRIQPETATSALPAPPNAAQERPGAPDGGDGLARQGGDGGDRRSAPGDGLIELPAGHLVGLTLAAGVSAALAAARIHQRRRRTPRDPEPGIAHTEPLATETVRRLRRADLAHQSEHLPQTPEEPSGPQPGPRPRHPGGPSAVTIGGRDGEPIALDLSGSGGLCLIGSAAADVARAAAIDFLAGQEPCLTELLIVGSGLAEDLLPGHGPVPGLTIREDPGAALRQLEAELIHRTRLIEDAEADGFGDFTRRHPAEPMPALLLLIAQPPAAVHARLACLVSLGRRLGVGALVLGGHPTLPTVTLDDAGRVLGVEPAESMPGLAGARLCSLSRDQAAELIAVVAVGRDSPSNGDGPTEPPTEAFPVQPAPTGSVVIDVRLFGPPAVYARGQEIRTGLRSKALELLAYLLLHPAGASVETAADALAGNADAARASAQFRVALSNLNACLRDAAGLPEDATVIQRAGRRATVDPTLVECDLWRFESALAAAVSAADDADAVTALEDAARCYNGDLAEGARFDWAEPAREDLRRRASDVLTRLADLHEQAGAPERALAVLEQAIRRDPHDEPVYRRIMRLQAGLGRPDAVARTYRLLQTRLAELDAEPDPETRGLHDQLLASPQE